MHLIGKSPGKPCVCSVVRCLCVWFSQVFFIAVFALLVPCFAMADDLPQITITDKTDPKIAELYQQLQGFQDKINEINSERKDKLDENYRAVKENEQSLENRTLTAATTAATGIGGMELARGLSEQKADENADSDMMAYIETMRCSYGDKRVKAGPTEIELPGGNDANIMKYRNEYFALAKDLKERKAALGMKPGIESEEILEKTQMGLYDDENTGITAGAYESWYRAQMLASEKDKQRIAEMKEASSKRVKGGAIAAGAGVVGGAVGNAIINKDAPKEESEKINAEYDKQVAEVEAEKDKVAKELQDAIAENAEKVRQYNEKLKQYQGQIGAVNSAPEDCKSLVSADVGALSEYQPIENETDSVPDFDFPDISDQTALLAQCSACVNTGGSFDSNANKCNCPSDKAEDNGKCIEVKSDPEPESGDTESEPELGAEPESGDTESEPELGAEPESGDTESEPESDTGTESGQTDVTCTYNGESYAAYAVREDTENNQTCICSPDGEWGCTEDEQEVPEDPIGEFCPGLDENGKNPNRLKSITNKTQIGDFCSSTNIAAGEVAWSNKLVNGKKVCTCFASACNSCCEYREGACNTKVVNGTGNCPRKEYSFKYFKEVQDAGGALGFCKAKSPKNCKITSAVPDNHNKIITCNPTESEWEKTQSACPTMVFKETQNNNTAKKCEAFCKQKTKEKVCKYKNSIMQHSKKQCVCNPDEEDLETSNLYKAVCGEDKGKTGKKEYCITDFKGVNVGEINASGLAKLYIKEKYKQNAICSQKYRESRNDDYIQCMTNISYYEFQFDDVKESVDADIKANIVKGIAIIYNKSYTNLSGGEIEGACTEKLVAAANRFAVILHTVNNGTSCERDLVNGRRVSKGEKLENKLDTIPNVDPKAFYAGIQINAKNSLKGQLKRYIISQGYSITAFTCRDGFETIYDFSGSVTESDDILRCYVTGSGNGKTYNKQPVDFVFQDASESWLYEREAGESAIECIVSGGVYAGQKCHGLTKDQCTKANKRFKEKNPDAAGMKWDGKDCVLVDAAQAKNYGIIVNGAVTVVAVADCIVLTKVGCAVAATEIAGFTTEVVTNEMIGSRLDDFLKESTKCKARKCAKQTIKTLGGRVLSVQSALDEKDTAALDKEFARLVGYLEPGDLPNVSDADWGDIVTQLGGDPNDSSGKALVILNKVGLIAQFASVGVSGLRLTGAALVKLGAKSGAKSTVKVGTKVSKIGNTATDATKGMTASQAKRLEELDSKIAKLESKTQRTENEAAELKKLRQERNTLKNKIGTKDADELAAMKKQAFDQKAVEDAQKEYETAQKRYDYMKKYMSEHNGNLPQGTTKYDLQTINNNMANAEKKLKDLGQDVAPVEPLQMGKKPTATPTETASKAEPKTAEPKPAEPTSKKPADKPDDAVVGEKATSGVNDAKALRNKVNKDLDNYIRNVKQSSSKEGIKFDKGKLSDSEWEKLNKELQNEGVRFVDDNRGNMELVKAENVADAEKRAEAWGTPLNKTKATPKETKTTSGTLSHRVDDRLDARIADVKRGKNTFIAEKSKLTDAEWNELNKSLESQGVKFEQNALGGMELKTINSETKVGTTATNTTTKTTSKATETKALRNKASENLDNHIKQVKKPDNKQGVLFDKNNMSSSEWKQLNKELKGEGVQLVDNGGGYMELVTVDKVAEAEKRAKGIAASNKAKNTTKATNKADDVADAGRATTKTTKTRSASELRDAVDNRFDVWVKEFRDTGKATTFENVKLTDSELSVLNESLKADNVKLVQVKGMPGVMTLKHVDEAQTVTKTATKTATKAANKADNVVDAGRATNKADNVADAAKNSNKADDVADVAKEVNKTDEALASALSRSKTLRDLNAQGRLKLTTSSSLNGKQYMRIRMGANPDMKEAEALVKKLQSEGFYVSSGTAEGGEKFIGVSRENIFEPWTKEKYNWFFNKADDVAKTEKPKSLWNRIKSTFTNKADDVADAAKNSNKADDVAERMFNQKFPGFKSYGNEGFKVSDDLFDSAAADSKVDALFKEGYVAKKVPTKGVGGQSERYVVVTLKQEDATRMGLQWTGNDFVKTIDNSGFVRNVNKYKGKEITRIGDTPVVLEETGSIGGRAVVTVRIGERKMPFYVSSGAAGKTSIPTGKWEAFWGVGPGPRGWFNKGGSGTVEEQIRLVLNHYDSDELRKIASALDEKLGDPRNTELILATKGRQSQNGVGIVAEAHIGDISTSSVNSGFKNIPGDGVTPSMLDNMQDMKDYLKRLSTQGGV